MIPCMDYNGVNYMPSVSCAAFCRHIAIYEILRFANSKRGKNILWSSHTSTYTSVGLMVSFFWYVRDGRTENLCHILYNETYHEKKLPGK